MPPPPHVRELGEMDELVEEILIRLPPDEPGNLLRASLVCKPWRCLLSGRGFRRRYRDFHQRPPMLGFLHDRWCTYTEFIPTTEFLPREPDLRSPYSLEDCRHGRVLLWYRDDNGELFLVVWDPITGSQTMVRLPEMPGTSSSAFVLCAADGCDHGTCHSGPSLVVLIELDEEQGVATASVYSPETSRWSSPVSLDLGFFEYEFSFASAPSVLAGGALCFLIFQDSNPGVLEYDLGKSRLSEIHLSSGPSGINCPIAPILMVGEDGLLGLAELYNFRLRVWWREVGPDEVAVWLPPRVVNLENLLPVDDLKVSTELVGSVEGTSIVFAITDLGTYMIDHKSLTVKEISTELYQREDTKWALFPYLSFYSPPAAAVGVVAEASNDAGHGNEEA